MTEQTMTDALEALIAAERDALKAGDFDRITELFEEKQELKARLDGSAIEPAKLAPLRDGMRRNHELFDQALAGLRNVAGRLSDMNRIRRSLNTNDAMGRSQIIDAPAKPMMERRA
jgi:hypothetical protein